jgi:hypothetical protein
MPSKQHAEHAPVNRHADRHSCLDSSFVNGAEKGKVGIGYGEVLGLRGASVFFSGRAKVGVGGVYAGDYADGIRNVALHLQLCAEVLGRGHGLDAGVRVVPVQEPCFTHKRGVVVRGARGTSRESSCRVCQILRCFQRLAYRLFQRRLGAAARSPCTRFNAGSSI